MCGRFEWVPCIGHIAIIGVYAASTSQGVTASPDAERPVKTPAVQQLARNVTRRALRHAPLLARISRIVVGLSIYCSVW